MESKEKDTIECLDAKSSSKVRKKHRNVTAIVVGMISFCILFVGMAWATEDAELFTDDLPDISTDEHVTEAISTAAPETTKVVSEETTVISVETSTSMIGESLEIETTYILNTSTKKFHYPDCRHVSFIKDENKAEFNGSRDELIAEGYSPCGTCMP